MSENNDSHEFPLGKKNFTLIGAGAFTVILGFFLMSGGGADDVSSYSDAIFDFRRMYISPIVTLVGYGLVMYGIIKK
jgi:hypothetical protein